MAIAPGGGGNPSVFSGCRAAEMGGRLARGFVGGCEVGYRGFWTGGCRCGSGSDWRPGDGKFCWPGGYRGFAGKVSAVHRGGDGGLAGGEVFVSHGAVIPRLDAPVSDFCAAEVASGDLLVAGAGISGVSDAEAAGGIVDDEPGAERVAVFVSRGAAERGGGPGRCEASVAEPTAADGFDAGGGRTIAGSDGGTGTPDGGGDVWLGAAGDGVCAAEDQGCGFRQPLHRGARGKREQGPASAAA